MTIHIVDDSKIFRERLVGLLTEIDGVTIVGESESAVEALDAICLQVPDLVVLDMRLKTGSGIDVLQKIKARNVRTRVIVVSNYPYQQYKEICLLLGAEHFFHKATEFDKVVELVTGLRGSFPSLN